MAETEKRFAILHVTSRGCSSYTRTDQRLSFAEVADRLRCYQWMNQDVRPPSFADACRGEQITAAQFDEEVSEYLNRRSDAEGVYDVNLDVGRFSVLCAGRGWKHYATGEVCEAAWQASRELKPGAREDAFLAQLKDRQLTPTPTMLFTRTDLPQGGEQRVAAFHVTEEKQDAWFAVAGPLGIAYAAASLRGYLRRGLGDSPALFRSYFLEAQKLSRNDYEWCCANRLGKRDLVSEVYDVDIDHGAFSLLADEGWRNYPIDAVCAAAYQAGRRSYASSEELNRRVLDGIAGQEIQRNALEVYIRGDRHLDPGEISFSDSVEQMDHRLNFYMDVYFPPDSVLGTYVSTDENDDYVNVYANYDLACGTLCDELDVLLWRGDCDCLEMKYRLSPEEKELLLPKIEEHCQKDTGMTLGKWREQYRAELNESEPTAEPESRILSPSEFAATIHEAVQSDEPARFRQAVSVQIESDEWISCNTFREYADAMQYPDPVRVHIPEDTAKMLTILVDGGQTTLDQAYALNSGHRFDDDGRECLRWPEPEEALEKLGLSEMAEEFRQDVPVLGMEPQM